MAAANMPDEFYELVAHHLPPEPPRVGPRGGRPWIPHRVAVRVIWFVLATGCRWEDVPRELGCSGRTAHRRLRAWEELGIWDRVHADLLRLLREADKLDPGLVVVDGVMVRAFGGGERTGPSPVDRRKLGTKHTLLVDRRGVPLAIRTAGANASDHTQIIPVVMAFPRSEGSRGGRRSCPTSCTRTVGTTRKPPAGSSGSWGSSRTSASGARPTGAGWGGSGGWSSGPSVGSRGCGGCGSGTTGSGSSETPGPAWPPVPSASTSSLTTRWPRRLCQSL